MQGPIGLWAFRLREMLGMNENLTEQNSWRFTTSTTFYKNVVDRPEEQAERITDNYQYVILADEHRVGKSGRMGHEQILDFCALHLIKRQVCIYPPLSLMYALSDKHGVRDPMLVDVMLPHVRMTAKATISESAGEAAKYLMEKEPGRNYDHLVAKVNTSCSAMGVFFVNKEGGMWTTANNGNKIGDDNGEDKNGIEIGESFKISSVKLEEGVAPTILGRDFVIATLAAPTVMKEPEKPAEAAAEGVDSTENGEATPTVDGDKKEGDEKKAPEEKK